MDLLLSTNSRIRNRYPTVNTLLSSCTDLFGLSQLYQLRGRVGRSKVQSYAYLTLPTDRSVSEKAQKRLQVMRSLDTLGLDFSWLVTIWIFEEQEHCRERAIRPYSWWALNFIKPYYKSNHYKLMLSKRINEAASGCEDKI